MFRECLGFREAKGLEKQGLGRFGVWAEGLGRVRGVVLVMGLQSRGLNHGPRGPAFRDKTKE